MLKKWLSCICTAILLLGLGGCEDNSRKVKIGVSIGAGGAARWQKDMAFMQERAKALGADIELRLNLPDIGAKQNSATWIRFRNREEASFCTRKKETVRTTYE